MPYQHYFSNILRRCLDAPYRIPDIKREIISEYYGLDDLAWQIVERLFSKLDNNNLFLMCQEGFLTTQIYQKMLETAVAYRPCANAVDFVVDQQEKLPRMPLWIQNSIANLLKNCADRNQFSRLRTNVIREMMIRNSNFRSQILYLAERVTPPRGNKRTEEFFDSVENVLRKMS